MSIVEKILKKRHQVRQFSKTRVPELENITQLINLTYELVASKQSLVPYKITILGTHNTDEKQELYDLTLKNSGSRGNKNIFAPYVLCFQNRLVDSPNPSVKRKMAKGHTYDRCNPKKYKRWGTEIGIEVGMFTEILTALCLENNIDVSFLLCFDKGKKSIPSFLNEEFIFSMQLGYKTSQGIKDKYIKDLDEYKPNILDIIKWL
jgi:hypothetical protein